ncbi:MAG: FKBP-type peptidyl-prolyl cis-trans isomerase [Acidobacteria bacterium]|nr:FKBP-type peptidyl-prolyl cis-trans isomerase [Acidobacteriota bacterium]MBS1866728.1 FKBP-type peptidyl-prolyl cis-trans isomerase [Acidobacteriota bacterium]
MKKQQTFSLILLASSALLASNAFAQTSPTSGAAQTPAAKPQTSTGATSATKPQASTAAKKPGTATAPKPASALALKTDREKASYAIGANIGRSMKKEGVDLDTAIIARGIKDGFSGGKLLLTDEQAQAALVAFSGEMKKKQEAQLALVAATNGKEGQTFLAANKTKPGVVTLPSGLQYKILTPGSGPKPTTADTILCNYRGTLLNGTEFDASEKHGGPATIPVGGVIKGWTEALQLMPVGSKWELYVPPDLAYGNRQAGPDIGPNSTLIFDVELVSIEKPKEAPAEAAKPAAPNSAPATAQPQAVPQTTPPAATQPAPKPPSL